MHVQQPAAGEGSAVSLQFYIVFIPVFIIMVYCDLSDDDGYGDGGGDTEKLTATIIFGASICDICVMV